MFNVFQGATTFNGDISKWDVSKVTNMALMFFGAAAFIGDISEWDVSKVTDMQYMFSYAAAFNGDISKWDVSKVTDMIYMFAGATSFNGDISEWNVSSVTSMPAMFAGATAFNGDISKWDVSKVTDMSFMFSGATAFEQTLCWDLMSETITDNMFDGSSGGLDPKCSKCIATMWMYWGVSIDCRYREPDPDPDVYDDSDIVTIPFVVPHTHPFCTQSLQIRVPESRLDERRDKELE
jgi:surface protein